MRKSFVTLSLIAFLFLNLISAHAKYDIRKIESDIEREFQRLKSSNGAVRLSAIKSLAKIPHKKAVKPLVYALSDRSSFMRRLASQALAKLKYREAVEPLIRRLKVEKELFVQREFILALGKLGDEKARWVIRRFLKHSSTTLKIAAQKSWKMLDKKD